MKKDPPLRYELYFRSLVQSGHSFTFPCDSRGQVHLDGLSERGRNNYLYARAMVGRELAPPAVEAATGHISQQHAARREVAVPGSLQQPLEQIFR